MKLFTVIFAGENFADAAPIMYSDSPEVVRLVVGYLADTVERAEVLPDVRLKADTEPDDKAAEA